MYIMHIQTICLLEKLYSAVFSCTHIYITQVFAFTCAQFDYRSEKIWIRVETGEAMHMVECIRSGKIYWQSCESTMTLTVVDTLVPLT